MSFVNGAFDPQFGVIQVPNTDIFRPKNWLISWEEEGAFEEGPGHRPEATILNEWMGLEPELFPSDSYTWKIFVMQRLKARFYPAEPLNKPAGEYEVTCLVWPKLHMLTEGREHPGDPYSGEVGLQLGQGETIWKHGLSYDKYNLLSWTLTHSGGEVPTPYFRFKGKWPIDNTFFLHFVDIQPLDEPPTPPPTPTTPVTIDLSQETKTFLEGLLGPSVVVEGMPRTPFDKQSVLYHPLYATESELSAVVSAMDDAKKFLTLDPSADNAAMGPGLDRHIYVLDASDWGGTDELRSFFGEFYPQATFEFLEAKTAEELYDEMLLLLGYQKDEVDVPFKVFSQRDPRWASHNLDATPYTLGRSGCAAVSTTMLGTLVAPDLTPATHNKMIGDAGGYLSDGRLIWSVAASVVDGLEYVSYHKTGSPVKLSYIQELLDQDRLLILKVDYDLKDEDIDSHFVAAVAPVIKNGELVDFIIADPYYGDVVRIMERYGKGDLGSTIFAIAAFDVVTDVGEEYEIAVHGAPVYNAPDDMDARVEQWASIGVGSIKLLHAGKLGMVRYARKLLSAGIEPVVRIYDAAGSYQGGNRNLHYAQQLIDVGVEKFEVMNEPNIEWSDPEVSWQSPQDVERVASTWFDDAQRLYLMGGNPGFVAFAPTERGGVNQTKSGYRWAEKVLDWLNANRRDTIIEWLDQGRLWAAIHLLPFNRPFERDAERTWGVDDMCLRYYEPYSELWRERFGLRVPEIVSTEGGVVSPKHMRDLGWPSDGYTVYDDKGNAIYNEETWGTYLVSMYKWLAAHKGPIVHSWTGTDQGVQDTAWIGCGWYDAAGRPRTPVKALWNI